MTEAILAALHRLHPAEQWLAFYAGPSEQRIDFWAMHLWPSQALRQVAYEIKVSRQDYQREIRQPLKRRWALLVSQTFYFVTPQELIRREELVPEAGLLELGDDGRLRTIVPAPVRDRMPLGVSFIAALIRRARDQDALEQVAREKAAEFAALKRENEQLHRAVRLLVQDGALTAAQCARVGVEIVGEARVG
jgi:hypothetical protein